MFGADIASFFLFMVTRRAGFDTLRSRSIAVWLVSSFLQGEKKVDRNCMNPLALLFSFFLLLVS